MPGKWSPMRFHSTWREYRYGSKKKPVTLAPIFRGKHREHAIEGILTRLRDWRQSPFEHEGPARAGVRSALCLAGHGWERADLEAASLVADGLKRIGARRPSWDEGQWQYANPRETCYRCGGAIDEYDQGRGYRYCSDLCARATRQHFSDELPYDHELMRRGYWQLVISNSPAYDCEQCGRRFKSWRKDEQTPRYCSQKCAGQARLKPEQPCAWCQTMFRPQSERVTCCSRECGNRMAYARRQERAPEKTCPHCKSIFRPRAANAVFCSKPCQRAADFRRKNPPKPPRVAVCIVCQSTFEAQKHNAQLCSPECSQERKKEMARQRWRAKRGSAFFCEAAE